MFASQNPIPRVRSQLARPHAYGSHGEGGTNAESPRHTWTVREVRVRA